MDHQTITADRKRRAEDLRAAAVAVLEQQSIAAGTLIDIDDDTCVAAGPKAAILMLLNGASQLQAAAPSDLEQRLRAQAVTPFGPEGFALLTEAADALAQLALQQAAPAAEVPALLDHAHADWISVEDREPAEGEEVLICGARWDSDRLYQAVARRVGDEYLDDMDEESEGKFIAVSHWAPLRPMPGEVSQGAAPTAADVRDAALVAAIEAASAEAASAGISINQQTRDYNAGVRDAVGAIEKLRAAQPNIQEARND